MGLNEDNRERLETLEKAEKVADQKEAVALNTALTVRNRLMRRLVNNTVKVEFSDDLGGFNIEVRMLTPEEQSRVGQYRLKLLKLRTEIAKNPTDLEELRKLDQVGGEILQDMYRLVADVCIDKSLDYEYWKSGIGFNADVPLRLLSESLTASQKVEVETKGFR